MVCYLSKGNRGEQAANPSISTVTAVPNSKPSLFCSYQGRLPGRAGEESAAAFGFSQASLTTAPRSGKGVNIPTCGSSKTETDGWCLLDLWEERIHTYQCVIPTSYAGLEYLPKKKIMGSF